MTQTQTDPPEGRDPDRRPDPDPGPDNTQTQPVRTTRTPDHRPDPGPGPDGLDSRPGLQTRTPRPDSDRATPKIDNKSGGPGPGPVDTGTDSDPDPAHWERFAAGWPQWLLTAVVAVMASVGQIQFAKANGATDMIWLPGGRDITALFAPFVFDLSVAGLYSYGIFVAVRYKAGPWLPWGAGTLIGMFSVYTNTLHRGALVFAPASAVLIISWLVRLVIKYRHLPHVKTQRVQRAQRRAGRRATAKPRLILSALVFASRRTAARAWVIARRRPIAAIAARMNRDGDPITERDLVIRAAELWITVHSDRVVAELAAAGDPPAKAQRNAYAAWCARRDQALRQAEIVAWDAVDEMLGLPVIQREGIRVRRLTYVEPQPAPVAVAPVIASVAAPAAPALPAAPHRRIASTPAAALASVSTGEPAAPGGNAGMNWLSLDKIPGLPEIGPETPCECHPDPAKRCGKTLLQHVQRRGQYLLDVVTKVPDWDTRAARIGKAEVEELCGTRSSGVKNEIGWVLDQLRALTQQQRAERDSAATSATVVTGEVRGQS